MTRSAKPDAAPVSLPLPNSSFDTTDSVLLRRVLDTVLTARAAANRATPATLVNELTELQAMLLADGPLISAYELGLLQDMRALLTARVLAERGGYQG